MSVAIEYQKPNDTEPQSILYGDERIAFERVDRKSNSAKVLIKVHPDCKVIVHAPSAASNDDVISAVKKRARWIYSRLREFDAQLEHVTPRQFISGESHYYLGKRYLLKVVVEPKAKQQVKLLRGKLEVTVRTKNRNKVKELLNDWYKGKAKEVFHRRLEAMLDKALWVDEVPPLRVLSMKTQWGSCSPQGRITLNPHLVKAHQDCIDYVILHELCHIAEHNHSEKFYRLIKQVMPNWEKVKYRLDSKASEYLASS